ncbi:MAG: DUF2092 domain-containing protein [Hyphomicrobiales bacterium]
MTALSRRTFLAGLAAAGATAVNGPARAADADALALLKAMGDTLAKARTMRFSTTTTMDVGGSSAEPAVFQVAGKTRVLFARPDRLRVQYGGVPATAELLSNGNATVVYLPRIGAKALLPSPTGGELTGFDADRAVAPHALFLPFVDIVTERPGARFTADVRQARIVLRDMPVNGKPATVVFVATPQFQGEIWIGKRRPLPRRIVGTYTGRGAPTFSAATTYSGWSLDKPAPAADFTAAGSDTAKTVPFVQLWKP